jgi:hypothetical protein
MVADKVQIQEWLEKFRDGTLTEDDFQRVLNRLNDQPRESKIQQKLLYLHTSTTGVNSEVLAMALVENGRIFEGPEDPAEWPYNSVIAAINDGWRVIKFPEMALLLQEDKTFGLGCEFILEKLE